MKKNKKLKKWIRRYGYYTGQAMFLLVAILAVVNALIFKEVLKSIEHSYTVIADIQAVGNIFGRAEASQHGYIISGNTDFLETYQSSVNDLVSQVEALKERAAGNPEQQQRANAIAGVIRDRVSLLNLGIREKQKGDVSVRDFRSNGAGNRLNERLRLLLKEMASAEEKLLSSRRARRADTAESTGLLVIFASLTAMLLGVTSRQIIKKERDENYRQVKLTRLILRSMREGIVVVNESGIITTCNKAAHAILGKNVLNVAPENWPKTFGMYSPVIKSLLTVEELPLSRAIKGEQIHEMEIFFKNKIHPKGVIYSITAMPILNEAQQVTGAVATFRDVSKRKATEEEWKMARQAAIEASKLKSDFLAAMSHEIRTPMNGILGMSTLLVDTKLNSEQFEYVNIIRKSTQALLTLINGILDLSKIEAGKLHLERAFFDLKELVEDTVELFRFSAAEKKIKLELEVNFESGLNVFSDSGRLRQVLVNLIGNAVKFTDEGQVKVRVTAVGSDSSHQKIRFEVKDTGIGLTADEIEKLFVQYGQTMSGVKKGGSGLGLLISQQIVGLLGGEVRIESKKGKGSTFWFEINMEASRAEFCVVPSGSLSSEIFSGRVLVVEDQKVNQKVISSILERLGIVCTLADNGRQGLDYCKAEDFDLVFMDCRMPVMDGYEATQKIRALPGWKEKPIVALSAEGASGDKERCFAVGMNDFVSKPIEMPALMSVLKKYLKSSQNQVDENALKQFEEFSTHEDLVLILIEEYKKAYPDSLRQMFEAEKAGQLQQLNELAHGLKSSSAALGMVKVAEICQWLEDAEAPSKQLKSRMQELEMEILSALRILTELKSRAV